MSPLGPERYGSRNVRSPTRGPGGSWPLQEHQVHEHEHALVFVLRGELLVSAGASERRYPHQA